MVTMAKGRTRMGSRISVELSNKMDLVGFGSHSNARTDLKCSAGPASIHQWRVRNRRYASFRSNRSRERLLLNIIRLDVCTLYSSVQSPS
jgi:hypothetical protein